MTKKPDKLNDLRRRAEATWSGQAVDLSQLSPADLHHMVHELQVHQIELEMQNEDLRQAQEQLAISQARYADLYDFAPVGYFTLDRKSMIQQANLTGADMLGVPRNELLQLPLSRFVAPDSQDDFYRHCRQTLQEGEKQTCEILLVKKDGSVFNARLESTAVPNPDGRISQMHTIISDISERKQMEESLQASEKAFHDLLNSITDYVWSADVVNGRPQYRYYSPVVEQITGYPPEHFMTGVEAWLNTIHPEDKARIEANYARDLAGEAVRHEYRIIRPDGAVRWLYGKVSPTLDETGQVMRLDGVVSDITERKQAEDRLARLNACFLNFGADPLANINQLTALCGELLDADCALYNRLHQGMLCSWGQWQTPPGYNPVDQPEGHICYDVIKQPKDDVVIIRNLAATAYAETDPNVKPFNLQTYIGKAVQLQEETAVGSLCVVYQRDFVPGDNDIQLMTLISGAIAIEERRKGARDSLKETQEHLAATLDALPDLLFEVGRDGRFYDFRAPDLDLLFVPPEMFLGKMVTEVLPPEAAAIIMDAIEQTAAGRQHIGAIYAFDMPIGKRWFEASMAAKGDLTTEDGRIIALSRDITQRVMAEDSLRKRTKQLETTLTELKETQAQLVQQERLAAVGQLAAGIAHDFNNLMATILLYSDLLLQTNKLNTKEQEKISVIYRQGQRAAHLTQQILDFSRKTIMEKKRLNLFLFLEDLISLLDRTLPENIHLRLSGEEETSFVYADPTRLEQVMMNLAINARNAMPNGGQLHIDLKQITVSEGGPPHPLGLTAGAWHQIRVSDTGVGIEPDILPRIFEPFFTTRAPLGSGLGLSQVYGIIKQLGGEVDVTSPPGQGATFTLFLPVMTATQQEIQPVGLAVATEGNGETLLVVEDDDHLRKALTESLTALNYQVISARNGRDALTMYHQHKNEIALILSDLVMPDMGGLELVQILKQNHTDLEVLIISGYPFADIKKDLKAAGVTNWLQKPLNLQSLGQTVSGILETKDQS